MQLVEPLLDRVLGEEGEVLNGENGNSKLLGIPCVMRFSICVGEYSRPVRVARA